MNFITRLNIDNRINKIFSGDIDISFLDFKRWEEDNYYPLPPFIMPLLINFDSSPFVIGYVNRWFSNQENCFVKTYVEAGFLTTEFARTADQLLSLWVLEDIVSNDDITGNILEFVSSVEMNNIEEINSFSLKYGDNIKFLNQLSGFKNKLPINSIEEKSQYNGDYASSERVIIKSNLNHSCYFETVGHDIFDESKPWLLKSNSFTLFEHYLESGDFEKAWLSLNGYGLSPKDVVRGLKKMIKEVDDSLFIEFSLKWIFNFENSVFLNDSNMKFI